MTKFKGVLFFLAMTLSSNQLVVAESKNDLLEKQIFWGITSLIADDTLFLQLPLFCIDNDCRNMRSLLSIQNLEMVFHEVARQEVSCKSSLKDGYDFYLKDTAKLIRKIAAIDQSNKSVNKMRSIIDQKFSKSKYWDMTCENVLRATRSLEEPTNNKKLKNKNNEIVARLKPHLCRQYRQLNSCLVEMSQNRTKTYDKIKQFAIEIKADDGVKEIKISTLN